MSRSLRRVLTLSSGLATVLAMGPGLATVQAAPTGLGAINHIVVIYEENHSFDNLYGGWEGVDGLQNADAAHTIQLNQATDQHPQGIPFACLLQNDVNLTVPSPLGVSCTDTTTGSTFSSAFPNGPFLID